MEKTIYSSIICVTSLGSVLEGFGGVSEYGITVRWDKNFLTLLHLTLEPTPRPFLLALLEEGENQVLL